MRKVQLAALVVAALVSTASFAGAQASTPGADRAPRAAAREMEGRHGGGLFRDIKLSSAEKAKVKEIHGKYRSETKALHESMKPAMKEARAARQKGDSAAARAVFERTKGDREKLRAVMDREKTELRSALTPEHQKLFDANVKQVAQKRGEWGKGKGGKGDRNEGKKSRV
jgi:Spy/CpxP family protein refolding chaperone